MKGPDALDAAGPEPLWVLARLPGVVVADKGGRRSTRPRQNPDEGTDDGSGFLLRLNAHHPEHFFELRLRQIPQIK